jgi:hypothetical protein
LEHVRLMFRHEGVLRPILACLPVGRNTV